VGLWAGLGVLVSCVVLELAGAALVTVAGTKWLGTNPTAQLALAMPDILYKATLLCIALGAISANALNIYSGAMAFLTVGLKLPLTLRRALVALVFGAIGFVVALTGLGGASTNYENFLLLISYWIAPWLGVVFTNYWLRRGEISDAELYNRRRENWSGPVAMLVGIVVSVYLFSAQALYTGPVPKAVPQVGDLTFLVGFLVAAVAYYLLNARLRERTPART
jgi:purine-cytosine permease-like protein